MPDCTGDACERPGKDARNGGLEREAVRGAQAPKSHRRYPGRRLKKGFSRRVTQAADGYGRKAGFEGPAGIVRGEGDKDLGLDLDGGSQEEGGE